MRWNDINSCRFDSKDNLHSFFSGGQKVELCYNYRNKQGAQKSGNGVSRDAQGKCLYPSDTTQLYCVARSQGRCDQLGMKPNIGYAGTCPVGWEKTFEDGNSWACHKVDRQSSDKCGGFGQFSKSDPVAYPEGWASQCGVTWHAAPQSGVDANVIPKIGAACSASEGCGPGAFCSGGKCVEQCFDQRAETRKNCVWNSLNKAECVVEESEMSGNGMSRDSKGRCLYWGNGGDVKNPNMKNNYQIWTKNGSKWKTLGRCPNGLESFGNTCVQACDGERDSDGKCLPKPNSCPIGYDKVESPATITVKQGELRWAGGCCFAAGKQMQDAGIAGVSAGQNCVLPEHCQKQGIDYKAVWERYDANRDISISYAPQFAGQEPFAKHNEKPVYYENSGYQCRPQPGKDAKYCPGTAGFPKGTTGQALQGWAYQCGAQFEANNSAKHGVCQLDAPTLARAKIFSIGMGDLKPSGCCFVAGDLWNGHNGFGRAQNCHIEAQCQAQDIWRGFWHNTEFKDTTIYVSDRPLYAGQASFARHKDTNQAFYFSKHIAPPELQYWKEKGCSLRGHVFDMHDWQERSEVDGMPIPCRKACRDTFNCNDDKQAHINSKKAQALYGQQRGDDELAEMQKRSHYNMCGGLERMVKIVKNDLKRDRGQLPSDFENCAAVNYVVRQIEKIGFAKVKSKCKTKKCTDTIEILAKLNGTNKSISGATQLTKLYCNNVLKLSDDKFWDSQFFVNAGGYTGPLYEKAKVASYSPAVYQKMKYDCAFQFNKIAALTGVPMHEWQAGDFEKNLSRMAEHVKNVATDPRMAADIGVSFAEGAMSATDNGLKYIKAEEGVNKTSSSVTNAMSKIGLGDVSAATLSGVGTAWKESSKAVGAAFNKVAGLFRKKQDNRIVWKDGTNPAQFFGCPDGWRPYMKYHDRGDYGKFWYGCQRDGYGGSPAVFYNYKGDFGNNGYSSPDHYGVKDMCTWSKNFANHWKPNPCNFRQK